MTAITLATFPDEGSFLRARTRALGADRHILGEWTPYATASLGGEANTRGIRAAVIVVGAAGAAALFALTVWSAVYAYPFDTGARPAFSWPAFIPAPVEFGALAAAIGGVILFFRRAGLTRLHDAAFDFEEVAAVSQGCFLLMLRCDAGTDANALIAMMTAAGATHSRVVGG